MDGKLIRCLNVYYRFVIRSCFISTQSAKSPKKQSERVRFCFGTQNTVSYCQKYTHTDCFFGDFAHWVRTAILILERNWKWLSYKEPPPKRMYFSIIWIFLRWFYYIYSIRIFMKNYTQFIIIKINIYTKTMISEEEIDNWNVH